MMALNTVLQRCFYPYRCLKAKFWYCTSKSRLQHSAFLVISADDGTYQRDQPPPPLCSSSTSSHLVGDNRKSLVPEEFAGLLHGSSPACEPPDTPYHLYSPKHFKYAPSEVQSSVQQTPDFSIVIGGGASQSFFRTENTSSPQRSQKPQVVYRTIFHTRVNQDQVQPKNCEQAELPRGWSTLSLGPSSSLGQNGEVAESQGNQTGGEAKDGLSGTGYEERACTLGRMRSVPRSVLDLQLSKSLSKSDSNLVAVSPIQVRLFFSLSVGYSGGGKSRHTPVKMSGFCYSKLETINHLKTCTFNMT